MMDKDRALRIIGEQLDRLREKRNSHCRAIVRETATKGEAHPGNIRVAEAYEHWINEMTEVRDWVASQ